jgi:hypothetical protein
MEPFFTLLEDNSTSVSAVVYTKALLWEAMRDGPEARCMRERRDETTSWLYRIVGYCLDREEFNMRR